MLMSQKLQLKICSKIILNIKLVSALSNLENLIFLLRVALNELKLSETDDLIVENESESVGENDVEEIEPEKANEEKNQKQSQTIEVFFFQKSKRALEPRT